MKRLPNFLAPLLSAASLSLLLSACAAKLSLSPTYQPSALRLVAVTVTSRNSDVPRERLAFLRRQLHSDLRNAGFVVLDQQALERVCSDPDCTARSELFRKYNISALAQLTIDSVSRNNFLAGYYNTISGDLRLIDPQGAEILSVDHTQRERGGLLFNSGQVLHGLSSQIDNTEQRSFERLAEAFNQALVDKLPRPPTPATTGVTSDSDTASHSSPSPTSPLQLHTVRVMAQSPSVYQVCAEGTPSNQAILLIALRRSTLREIRPGHYCGVFRIDDPSITDHPITVELRSPFGDAVRKAIAEPLPVPCPIAGGVQLVKSPQGTFLEIGCATESQSTSSSERCVQPAGAPCPDTHFALYTADQPIGPYTKVTETRMRQFSLTSQIKLRRYVAVVSVNKDGIFSPPQAIEIGERRS